METVRRRTIKDLERRIPVLDQESSVDFSGKKILRQWRLLTEVIKREIFQDEETQEVVRGFISTPVSELLPQQFLTSLEQNPRIQKLIQRYSEDIGRYLELDAVPDEQINPDVQNAPFLPELSTIERLREDYGMDESQDDELIEALNSVGEYRNGLTYAEKQLVLQRYQFARDVKMLALQAEAIGTQGVFTDKKENEFVSPGGVEISFHESKPDIQAQLLHPELWEKRAQIKDRVYEIQVGESKFILKERKTARHEHTLSSGHKPGLTSQEEFEVAKSLGEKGVLNGKHIRLDWEKPIAAVTFPDGFQFTVFEYEEGLLNGQDCANALAEAMKSQESQFRPEYEKVATQVPELSFNDFVKVKTLQLTRRAHYLKKEMLLQMGLKNIDSLGTSLYKVHTDPTVQVELLTFDFEYIVQLEENEKNDLIKKQKAFKKTEQGRRSKIPNIFWPDGTAITEAQGECYRLLVEEEGELVLFL